MGKLAYILLGAILVIAIIAGVAYFKIFKSSTTTAFLNIESGTVEVDTGNGWQLATDQMKLGLNDKIRTGTGKASVVLYESVIISLEPNTEISLKDLSKNSLKVEQPSGQTWNKFTGITGVSALSVETPNTVATVRGTFFGVGMQAVHVGEGIVVVEKDGQKIQITSGKKATVKDGKLVEEDLTPEELAEITKQMQRTLEQLKQLRMREVEKNSVLANQLKKQYGITDAQVKEYLERADKGEFDLDEIEQKSPVKIESVHKIKLLTEEIIKQNKAIAELQKMGR
ncbi:MAG: FecR domain-containing protein [Candidatus Woesearchaeota archaeon]